MRTKNKEAEMSEYEELEKLADKGNARKFYEKIRRTEQTLVGRRGDLVTDAWSILNLWRAYFSSLLNGSKNETPGYGEPEIPIDDDGTDLPLPDHVKVRLTIVRLKNNKAAGADCLPAELFKHEDKELAGWMHQLFLQNMVSVVYLIHRKVIPWSAPITVRLSF